jgi:hypothetical protein
MWARHQAPADRRLGHVLASSADVLVDARWGGYKAIRHLRQDNAKYTGVLVEAGAAPPEER